MPFGLVNAGATFSRLMQHILEGLEWHACLIYLDEIIAMGHNVELEDAALSNLDLIFTKLENAGVK
jgi:hypothetical protein